MKVKKEYLICDRCNDTIEERWGKQLNITKYKKRWFIGQYVTDSYMDLCGGCSEKFERFMKLEIDDNKPTRYEEYYTKGI